MTTNILSPTPILKDTKRLILLAITLMLSGRAMTLAFIGQAGDPTPGAPPIAWLMPLIGDAVIGLSALFAAYLIVRGLNSTFAIVSVVVFHALGIWDAMSAFIVHLTTPWPSFFMVEIFGGSMFFMASAMHAICIALVWRITRT